MSSYFNVTYPVINKNYSQKYATYMFNRFFFNGGKILDAGCANGSFLDLMQKKGLDCYGVDLREEKLVNNKIIFKQCNLEKDTIPFDNDMFDYVYCKSVISMMLSCEHFFGEVLRVLKPGGKFICLIPDWKANQNWYYDDPTYVKAFTQKGLRYYLQMCNFENVDCEKFYQLPFLWKYPKLKLFVKLIAKIVPDRFKFKNKYQRNGEDNKLIRFSKEPMLLSIAEKL